MRRTLLVRARVINTREAIAGERRPAAALENLTL